MAEAKAFSSQDGMAMRWLLAEGFQIGWISGRDSPATVERAKNLGVTYVYQHHLEKLGPYAEILAKSGATDEQVCYLGDDLPDAPVMKRAGLAIDAVNAYQRSASLKAAIELDVFTAIGAGSSTAAALAKRCKVAERGARILCDYLTIQGFLSKKGDAYGLTPDSAVFLDKRSPAYIGSSVDFLLSDHLTSGFRNLADAVRKGGAASELGS